MNGNIFNTVNLDDYLDVPYNVEFDKLIIAEKKVEEVVGLFLGLCSALIVIFMTVITAMDVAYINIPIFQDAIHRKNWDGSDANKFRVVSRDAADAVREAVENDKRAMSLYLKKRMKTYIKSAITLAVFISGSDLIVNIVKKIVKSILGLV